LLAASPFQVLFFALAVIFVLAVVVGIIYVFFFDRSNPYDY
jgi:hypothetical protein